MKGSDISGIVVAEIKSVEEHPESKKLHLLKVDISEDELVDVVCGAPNVAVGLKVPFAKLGAQIGDITIAPRKLAGFTSNGMCCSEKELGISDNNDGLMILDPAFAVGTDIKTLFDIDDIIWMGPQPSVKELAAKVGVEKTAPFAKLADCLSALILLQFYRFILPCEVTTD